MKLNFWGDVSEVMAGIHHLEDYLGFTCSSEGYPVELINRPGSLRVEKEETKAQLYFSKAAHLYRGLTLLLRSEAGVIEEFPNFETLGTMLDVSRNAVLKQAGMEAILLKMASLGMDSVLLYMEDVYEIPEYPYFGYMRGRYTHEELQKMDDFAFDLGIELIPCIQTLAHLQTPLQWGFGTNIKDTRDILLVGEEETYQFLEASIKGASRSFRTNKIHIGMDEALQLGLGKYREKHGDQDRFDILISHLRRVMTIVEANQLEAMMWSDMFLRIGSVSGDYYDEKTTIPQEVIAEIPEIDLVYWDYYNPEQRTYEKVMKTHHELARPIIFAGGIWTFNGIAPNYGRTLATTNAALQACKAQGIKQVYATMWFDDGAETPIETSYLGLQQFAEHQFHRYPSLLDIEEQFSKFQGEEFATYMLLDQFDQTPGVIENNRYSSAVSKLILYQDLLLGLYDETIKPYQLGSYYDQLADKLLKVTVESKNHYLFDFYQKFAKVLSLKAELGINIKEAYDRKNLEQMKEVITIIQQLTIEINELQLSHQICWNKMNKTIGWEVLEVRYGGLINRCQSVSRRLTTWLSEPTSQIEELEYERLVFDDFNSAYEGTLGRNFYQEIVSPNKLSNF